MVNVIFHATLLKQFTRKYSHLKGWKDVLLFTLPCLYLYLFMSVFIITVLLDILQPAGHTHKIHSHFAYPLFAMIFHSYHFSSSNLCHLLRAKDDLLSAMRAPLHSPNTITRWRSCINCWASRVLEPNTADLKHLTCISCLIGNIHKFLRVAREATNICLENAG